MTKHLFFNTYSETNGKPLFSGSRNGKELKEYFRVAKIENINEGEIVFNIIKTPTICITSSFLYGLFLDVFPEEIINSGIEKYIKVNNEHFHEISDELMRSEILRTSRKLKEELYIPKVNSITEEQYQWIEEEINILIDKKMSLKDLKLILKNKIM